MCLKDERGLISSVRLTFSDTFGGWKRLGVKGTKILPLLFPVEGPNTPILLLAAVLIVLFPVYDLYPGIPRGTEGGVTEGYLRQYSLWISVDPGLTVEPLSFLCPE